MFMVSKCLKLRVHTAPFRIGHLLFETVPVSNREHANTTYSILLFVTSFEARKFFPFPFKQIETLLFVAEMSFKRKLSYSSPISPTAKRRMSTPILSVISLLLWSASIVEALAASVSKSGTTLPTTSLQSIDSTQFAVLDGAEWASIQRLGWNKKNEDSSSTKSLSKYGYMNVLVGTDVEGQRIVGMQASDNQVYQESVARVPSNVKHEDAISTYIAGISAIHSVLPRVEQVGGSGDAAVMGGKVVVVGGNDLACFAAEGLSTLGVQVCLVSTGSPKVRSTNTNKGDAGKVEIVKPAVGSDGTGFSEYVGEFDSLLDTISNEVPLNSISRRLMESDYEEEDDVDDDVNNPFASIPGESSRSVVNLLKSRHSCHTYVSTMTHSQSLVAKEGILGGPRQADEYAKRVGQQSFVKGNPDCQPLYPWSNLGSTVESLLDAGILFSGKTRDKLYQKSKSVRGWTLGDFWEQSTWPRDSSGSAQIRFGLPVVDDPNLDEELMIAEAPLRPGTGVKRQASTYESFDFSNKDDYLEDAPPTPVQENPFVYQVAGVQGVKAEIMEQESDCILFLSAKFCKTCRTINPQYTRMARIAKEEGEVVFAKAETSGRWGKELGRYLEVEAVPAFILFRKGARYGSALSVSKLPSKKIDRALQLLESGAEWDPDVLKEDEKNSK